jgi:hypothetical protein
VEGGETRRPFIARRLGGDDAVTLAILPYHSGAVEAPRAASALGGGA